MIALLLAAAAATPDCYKIKGAIAKDECLLTQSMALDPPPNCANQMTQFDMNVCTFRDYLRSDIEMNHAWEHASAFAKDQDKRLRQNTPKAAGEFDRLIDSQRKWNAFRDAQCEVEAGPREGGGSMWAMNSNWCMKKLTDGRITQLREYVEPKN